MKTKIYTYDELWENRHKVLKKLLKGNNYTNKLHEWEKSQKFVKVEDYEQLKKDYNKILKELNS